VSVCVYVCLTGLYYFLHYIHVCCDRVGLLFVCRLARLAQRPVSGFITAAQLDFSGRGQQMVKCFPELTGVAYRDLKFYFPDSTVVGLLNMEAKTCKWDPIDVLVRSPSAHVKWLRSYSPPSPLSPFVSEVTAVSC
jgi:hypothetical protein